MEDKDTIGKFIASGDIAPSFLGGKEIAILDQFDAKMNELMTEELGPEWRSLDPSEFIPSFVRNQEQAREETEGADKAIEKWGAVTRALLSSGKG